MYNLTYLQNANTAGKLVIAANEYTNQAFVGMFLVAVFFILMFIMKRYDFEKAFLASNFICFLIGSILSFGGYVNFLYPAAFLGLAAFTFLFMTLFQSKS